LLPPRPPEGLNRKFNSWCWNRLVCLLFRMQIKDINCAFKLFKRQMFDDMELWSTGALINAEILARATRHGYSITQVGVHHFPRTWPAPRAPIPASSSAPFANWSNFTGRSIADAEITGTEFSGGMFSEMSRHS